MSMERNVVILPVKAKKHGGADVKVDPLFHANRTVIHQESPIIPPRIWEKCRTSHGSCGPEKCRIAAAARGSGRCPAATAAEDRRYGG